MTHERFAEHAHETGHHHQIGARGVDRKRKRGIERITGRKIAMIERNRLDAMRARESQPRRIRDIGDDTVDFAAQCAIAHRRKQRREIGAASG